MKKLSVGLIVFLFSSIVCLNAFALEVESLGVDIHGFIAQGVLKSSHYNYLANDSNRGSFQFNEVGINFSKQVTDNLRIGAQLFSRDLGDVANNKVTLDWAYGDYQYRGWLGVRAGRIKIPLGLFNEIRDLDVLRTCIILPQGIYNDLLRGSMMAQNGIALYGTIPMSVVGTLEYQAQAGVMNVDVSDGTGKSILSTIGAIATAEVSDFNSHTNFAGSLRWNTPLSGLALKASLFQSESDVPMTVTIPTVPPIQMSGDLNIRNMYQMYSAEFIWRDLTLIAEYMTNTPRYEARGSSSSVRVESYYGMASYRFTPWLEVGAYYSETYPDASDKKGDRYLAPGMHDYWGWQKDASTFARFDVNDYLILKIEGHYVDGTAGVLTIDNPTRDDKNWFYFAAKATFSF